MRSAIVISPSLSSNALGRALAIAELLGEVAEDARVYGRGRGQLWAGAAQHRAVVRRVSGGRDLVEEVAALPRPRVMWVVKAMPQCWRLARALSQALPETALVLDLDDDDEALAAEFRARSVGNRLRLNRLRAGHPGRIRGAMEAAVPADDGITYSSQALAEALDLPADRPLLCVPHPRYRAKPAARRERSGGRVHVGCLGTLREHKGIDALDALLVLEPSLVLHVFEGAPERLLAHGQRRVIVHDGATPLEELYGEIDVTLLPQDTSRGARLQLPAKLLDAMRFGVPVMATPTPAIEEAAAGVYRPVADWRDGAEVVRGIRECAASRTELGERGRVHFEREFAIEAQLPRVAGFTAEVADIHLAAARPSSSSR